MTPRYSFRCADGVCERLEYPDAPYVTYADHLADLDAREQALREKVADVLDAVKDYTVGHALACIVPCSTDKFEQAVKELESLLTAPADKAGTR